MNIIRKIAARTSLIAVPFGGGALTAMAQPANAATTPTPSATSTSVSDASHGNKTDLTGDAAINVKAAVLAANAGATVENMTTEDDGSAAYEALITKTDGTHATVKLDTNFAITAAEAGAQGGHGD